MLSRGARRLALCVLSCSLSVAEAGLWLDVPFIPQEKNGCGSASIAMVMQYWAQQQKRPLDASADPSEIQRRLYSKQGRGIYASGMEKYFEAHGFRAYVFHGEWPDLQQHLEKGRPLIVALKPQQTGGPLHYIVVAGLDTEQGLVLVNDPAQRKLLKQDRSSFEREWSATGKWTLLALPAAAAR